MEKSAPCQDRTGDLWIAHPEGCEYETNALPTEPKEHGNGVTCANFKTIFLILCLTCTVFLYYKIQK